MRPRFAPSRFALVLATCLGFLISVPVYAQVTGATLTGTVQDTSGSILPNAQIAIKNVSTDETRDVVSNADGVYSAPNLLPGSYEVKVAASGFATEIRSGITLSVGAQQVLNITMQVGQLSQQVQVSSEAPTVELASATLSGLVESTTVTELPLNGRDWTQLATLQPGVNSLSSMQSNALHGTDERVVRGNGNQVAIGGTRPEQNNYRVDGVSILDYSNNSPGNVLGFLAGVDAIGEFNVLTSVYSAQYGKTSGGVIDAITKSGSNQFHGTAYEFLRNSALDARNFFDPPAIPEFRRNQFGASAGGPIWKNKTFFFVDYEGFRQFLGGSNLDIVPSATARAGTIFSDNMGTITSTTVTVNPTIQTMLGFWPAPNGALISPGNTGFYSVVANQIASDDFATARFDHKFSDKDSASGTYSYDNSVLTLPADNLGYSFQGHTAARKFVALQETHIFSSRLVNSVRFGFARSLASAGATTSSTNPLSSDLSLGSIPGHFADALTVAGLTVFNGGIGTGAGNTHHFNSFQGDDDAFFTTGIHSIKFGFSVERQQDNMFFANTGGSAQFGSLTNFLIDSPSLYRATEIPPAPAPRYYRDSIFGGYVQDDIHLRRNLTANVGLRYEVSTVPSETQGRLATLATPSSPVAELGNSIFKNPTLRNFEPRIGFAWDPFGDGKSSIRGGFGVYDILPLLYLLENDLPQVSPWFLGGQVKPVPEGAFPGTAFSLLRPTSFRDPYFEPDPKRNYVMQWNLSAQHQLAPDLTATVAYVGSRGVHMLYRMGDGDIVEPTLTSAGWLWPASGGVRINPAFGRTDPFLWGSNSSYDALQFSVVKRMSHGFQVQGSYTWGRSIDDGSGGSVPDTLSNGLDTFTFDPAATRGPSDFDVAQNLTISYTWVIPTPESLHGPAVWAVRGWQLGGIFTARTGIPFSPQIAPDPLGESNTSAQDFPDRVKGCNPVSPGNVLAYINLSCFTVPMATPAIAAQCVPFPTVPGSCGNLLGEAGRNVAFGPGEEEFDFSLFKNFQIKEHFDVQFRAELFNVLNHANFNPPIDNIDVFDTTGAPVGGAGALDQTSTTSRQIQFGLKVIW